MKKLLKVLNPAIYVINLFMYLAHLENFHPSRNPRKKAPDYKPYDFSKDFKYF